MTRKVWHEGTTTDLQLRIYVGVLPIMKEHVMVFQVGIFYQRLLATPVYKQCCISQQLVLHSQGSQTLVHKLHDKQLDTFQLFSCFVKAEYITKVSPKTMGVMVLQEKMLLSAREMYVVWEADGFITRNPNHAVSTLQFNYI